MEETSAGSAGTRPLPVLVFDGQCSFCTAAVEWLARRLERPARLVPWQATELEALGLAAEDARRAVWWIEPTGERFHSEAAVARALMACGPRWQRLGRLLLVPGVRAAAAAVYRLVARIRHRLPGTTPACRKDWARVGPPSRGPG